MQSAVRRAFPWAILLLLGSAVVWALSFGTLPPADYTFSNDTEIESVDPANVTGNPEGRIIRCLFEGLVNWHPKTLEPIPGVAERWEISSDGKTYTYFLRDNALWSDGTPVTAHDFHWSFRRFLHPETAAEYSYQLWYAVGARDYSTSHVTIGQPVEVELREQPPDALPYAGGVLLHGVLRGIEFDGQAVDEQPSIDERGGRPVTYLVEIDGQTRRFQQGGGSDAEDYKWLLPDFDQTVGIRVRDKSTLEIELNNPTPYFLQLSGFYPLFPVNRRCVETYGYPAWTKPEHIVSNGPFLLESRRIRDRIRMVKNPDYWDRDNVHFNVVDALAVASDTTALNLYMTGELDYLPSVPATIVPELLAQDRPDFQPTPFFGTYYYRLNTTRPPLDNVLVRRALNLAINKREIVEKVTRAGQIPARSLVPMSIREYVEYTPAECGEYDVEEARRLLAEAGFPEGRGFPKIQILYNTQDTHKSIAELIQSQWKRALGIDVSLQNQEWAVYLGQVRQMEYWVARAAWIGDYLDPNTFLDMFVTDGANNQTGWSNPRYDELLKQANRETDPARRFELLHESEAILMDELPVIPIYYYVTTFMVRPYVEGFYHNIQDVHPLQGMSIDVEEKQRLLEAEGLR